VGAGIQKLGLEIVQNKNMDKKLIQKKGYTFNITLNPYSTKVDYDNLITVDTIEEAVKVNNFLKLINKLEKPYNKELGNYTIDAEGITVIYKFIKENYPEIEFEDYDEDETIEDFNLRILEDYFTQTPLECLYNWDRGLHDFEYYTYYCPEDLNVEMIKFD